MTMSRLLSLGLAGVLLAGCEMQTIPDATRAEQCRARFEAYDRALAFQPAGFGVLAPPLQQRGPGVANPVRAAEAAILQGKCTTFPREVADIATMDLDAYRRPVADNAAPRRYLHLGIVTSNGTEAVLRDRLSALGWPVRVKGAERLGRRVFIGPLETEPEEETALALARALGFDSAYFLPRIP